MPSNTWKRLGFATAAVALWGCGPAAPVSNQDAALRQASRQAFYNTSQFTLRDLKARAKQQQLKSDFEDYLNGFSPNVQEILTKFKFRDQIQTLVDAHVLGYLIEDFLDPEVNISPLPVKDADGRIKLPALDNHGMGTVFEELIRRFNEENNEEAGEHFTPRDVVNLMAKLLFLPVADQIQSGTYLRTAERQLQGNAADLLAWSTRVGRLAPGFYADLIAVTGDPLADVSELERVRWVMKNGVVYKDDRSSANAGRPSK